MNIFSSLLCHSFKCWAGMAKVITPTITRGTCGTQTLRKYTGLPSYTTRASASPLAAFSFFWLHGAFTVVQELCCSCGGRGSSSGGLWVSPAALTRGNPSSLTADAPRAPCTGGRTLHPLDPQGSPWRLRASCTSCHLYSVGACLHSPTHRVLTCQTWKSDHPACLHKWSVKCCSMKA